jgi:hypothetical protein
MECKGGGGAGSEAAQDEPPQFCTPSLSPLPTPFDGRAPPSILRSPNPFHRSLPCFQGWVEAAQHQLVVGEWKTDKEVWGGWCLSDGGNDGGGGGGGGGGGAGGPGRPAGGLCSRVL